MRLIDADNAINNFFDYCKTENVNPLRHEFDGAWIEHFIDLQPTVEAEPIRHGGFARASDRDGEYYICNQCGEEIPVIYITHDGARHPIKIKEMKVCPYCFAKMDGKEE